MTNIEDIYPSIITEVMKYIEDNKRGSTAVGAERIAIIDLIMDFCHKYDYEVEMVGDAIRSDTYFKSFIEKDCEINNFLLQKDKTKKIGTW